MKSKKLALAVAALLAAGSAYAAQHDGKTTPAAQSRSQPAPAATTVSPGTNAPAASVNAPVADTSAAISGDKVPSESPMTAKPARASAPADESLRQAQQMLKDKGHDPGTVDGVMGPKTQSALKSFQQAQGLSASGSLDSQTSAALSGSGASKPSAASAESSSTASASTTQPSASAQTEQPSASQTSSQTKQ